MSCVIFGAGKIARGFIGHLLYLSGIPFTFVEKSETLAALLKERKSYHVNILGNPDKNCIVQNFTCLDYHDKEKIAKAIAESDAVFHAVGGKNLAEIVPYLAAGIEEKAKSDGRLNIVACENWKKPADLVRTGIQKLLSPDALAYFTENTGVTEAVILRSAIEPEPEQLAEDPLMVNVQDYWDLHVDSSRLCGSLPPIQGLHLIEEFDGFLERKFYTYNAANGSLSYLGALLGYEIIAEAAHDERILKILDGVYHETGEALCRKYGFSMEDQMAFAKGSLQKLQNYVIVDKIERNARDPLRKLGPDDRLVGSARLVASYGIVPASLCTAIAAAMYYHNEGDPSAVELERLRKEKGLDYILENICRLDPQGNIARLVKEKEAEILKLAENASKCNASNQKRETK